MKKGMKKASRFLDEEGMFLGFVANMVLDEIETMTDRREKLARIEAALGAFHLAVSEHKSHVKTIR